AKAKKFKENSESIVSKKLDLEALENKITSNSVSQKWNYTTINEITDRLDSEHYKKKFSVLDEHFKELTSYGIRVIELNEIIEKGSYGILPSSSDYGKGELTFIRSTDLNQYMIDFDSCEKVPMEYYVKKAQVSS